MNKLTHIFFFCLLAALFSCKQKEKDAPGPTACSTLDKEAIYSIARAIIDSGNEHIWNISELDTTKFFVTEDFFIDTKSKSRLVLIDGIAGLSSGSADNLLLLFDCSNSSRVVWAGQVGDIDSAGIQDVSNDGIKELVLRSGAVWMGECFENYSIFNFKDGTQNMLYTARSNSVIDCGNEELNGVSKGDTLEYLFDCTLFKKDSTRYAIREIRTARIHQGGQSPAEIIRNLAIKRDTAIIDLN